MYIHEAIKARDADHPFITREHWLDTYGHWHKVKILPTNSPDGMVIDARAQKDLRRGWQPTAEDLTANDWVITV